jgi:intergrase/recombinase
LWSNLKRQTGVKKALKDLRKTSANRLHEHEVYGRYTQHFLGHVPSDVTNQHYVLAPSDAKFFPALEWLGRDLGLLDDSAARDASD